MKTDNPAPMPPRRPVVLIILDGFGVNPGKENNAVYLARTPNLDHYFGHTSHTTLQASGPAVGVPDGQMGNSEIGHMTLGCGCILRQDIVRIDDAIHNGEFFDNPALLDAVNQARERQRPLHLLGLVSDGGVHSSLDHLLALIQLAKQHGVKPLLHMVTDGRDTAPKSALTYLHRIEPVLHEAGGAIATVMGRYYAMDRDKRWERTELAWRAIIHGEGQKTSSAETGLRSAYAAGDSDEFIRPCILPGWEAPQAGDPMISFNFRKDRPQQIVAALGKPDFDGFDRGDAPLFGITIMMPYDPSLKMPAAFQPERPPVTLAEVISNHGLKQFHCAETEKYPHVTYFFNGGHHEPYVGETQLLIPSPKVATYDLKPSMSADKISAAVVQTIEEKQYGFILVNFANGDMVGHTAKPEAVIEAVEALDTEVGKILESAQRHGYSVILTADHGNCEEMVDPITGAPHTQHTLYPVPCLIMDKSGWQLSCQGGLANIAPTVLQLMGIEQPQQMTSSSLLLKPVELPQAQINLRGAA
jgi:2,3-bisphosphoglycerate-independent phosphoglycerate mutase